MNIMLLIAIAMVPFTIWNIKRKTVWQKEIEKDLEWGKQVWELFKQRLEAED